MAYAATVPTQVQAKAKPPAAAPTGFAGLPGTFGTMMPKPLPPSPQQAYRNALLAQSSPELQYLSEGQRRDQLGLNLLNAMYGAQGQSGGGGGGGGGANPYLAALQNQSTMLRYNRLKGMFPYFDQLLASQIRELDTHLHDDKSQWMNDVTGRGAINAPGTPDQLHTLQSVHDENALQAKYAIDQQRADAYVQLRQLQLQMAADAYGKAHSGGDGGGGGGGTSGLTPGQAFDEWKRKQTILDRISGRNLQKKKLLQGIAGKSSGASAKRSK